MPEPAGKFRLSPMETSTRRHNPLIECVPNFSEGRDPRAVEKIAAAMAGVAGATLLSCEMGEDAHRSVMTLIGSPEAVCEAAFRGIMAAGEVIDMRRHRGAHPRLGAADVCPLVPLRDVSMPDCVAMACELGRRVGEEAGIPVYLYREAATRPAYRYLANVRRGQYEGLPERLRREDGLPDFGPAIFNAGSGASIIGARDILIALNVSLSTADPAIARDIARKLRESGEAIRENGRTLVYREGCYPAGMDGFLGGDFRATRTHCRKKVRFDPAELLLMRGKDPNKPEGEAVFRPGKFPGLRAIGWYLPHYRQAQISMNIENYRLAPPHLILEKVRELAGARGVAVVGSELIGLAPRDWFLEAGAYYGKLQGISEVLPEQGLIGLVIAAMGLDQVAPFDAEKKILRVND